MFKTGDKAKIKKGLVVGEHYNTITYLNEMKKGGTIMTVRHKSGNGYVFQDSPFYYSAEMLEPVENKQTPIDYLMDYLGVVEGEKFNIVHKGTKQVISCSPYMFKSNKVIDNEGDFHNAILGGICSGVYVVQKLPQLTPQEAYTEMVKLIAEYNDGWVPDWEDSSQAKYRTFYNHKNKNAAYDFNGYVQELPNELYVKDNKIPLDKIEPLYKIWLGVK